VTTKAKRLWQPPNEAIETLAGALRSHWAAAKAPRAELFWPKPANWLRRQATRLVSGASDSPARSYRASLTI
jgi:hypothetical protein